MHDWSELRKLSLQLANREDPRTMNRPIRTDQMNRRIRRCKTCSPKELCKEFFPNNENAVLRPNKYPYELAPDIKHHVFWLNPKYHDRFTEQTLHTLDQLVKREYSEQSVSYITFINPEEWKSIPEIPHMHVFVSAH